MNLTGMLFEQERFRQHTPLFLLAVVAVIAGIFFRFWDLGGAPLSVDEYFLGTSILNTAKRGLPEFACGGYYTRGVLLQYLTLPLLDLGANLEFAVRFWPAVASILSIAAVWRIAIMAGGIRTALIAVILMSLSLWEVEFARFGRMYAPFQAAFLWYTYFQIQHLIKGNDTARWWYLGISAITVFIFEGVAMLLVFNFLALIWPGKRWTIPHLTVASGILFTALTYLTGVFRLFPRRVDNTPPTFGQGEDTLSTALPIPNLPGLPHLPESLVPILAMGVCLLGLALWRYRGQLRVKQHPSVIFWFIALLCFCAGFMSFGIALVLAGWLMGLPLPVQMIDMRARSLIGRLAALFFIWVAVLVASFQLGGADMQSSVKDALRYILDVPDVYFKVAVPWMQAIPITTVSLTILATVTLNLTTRSHLKTRPEAAVTGYVFGALILLVLLVTILLQSRESSRYTYFLYPLLIILASVGLDFLASTRITKRGSEFLIVVALIVPAFVFAEDFRLSHLARINETEIRYRVEYDTPLADHYYPRWDFRGAASHVNAKLSSNDSVIVFDQPLPHYLDRTSAIFVRDGSAIHRMVSACDNQRDVWSNAPLIDQDSEVQQLLDEAKGKVWLIVRTDRYAFRDPLEWLLVERYGLIPEFISQDGFLAVYVIAGDR